MSKTPQTSLFEKPIDDPKTIELATALDVAEKILEGLHPQEFNKALKARKDAKRALLEALPPAYQPTLYRCGDVVVRVSPPSSEESDISFHRVYKPTLTLVGDEE